MTKFLPALCVSLLLASLAHAELTLAPPANLPDTVKAAPVAEPATTAPATPAPEVTPEEAAPEASAPAADPAPEATPPTTEAVTPPAAAPTPDPIAFPATQPPPPPAPVAADLPPPPDFAPPPPPPPAPYSNYPAYHRHPWSSETAALDRPNVVSLEAGGRAIAYSVDFDREMGSYFALGLGASHWDYFKRHQGYQNALTVIPLYMNFYFSPGSNRGFVTTGADFVAVNKRSDSTRDFQAGGAVGLLGGGYEFRGAQGFLLRAAGYFMQGRSFNVSAGLSVGYAF